MKIYVVRHGESEANLKRFFAGWAPVSLTEKGKRDAESIRPYMTSIKFDKVYSSDLIRSIETTEAVLPGAEYETTPLLREVNVGNLMGKDVLTCDREMGETLVNNRSWWNYEPYGGESLEMLCDRAKQFLTSLEDKPYENVAVFAHEGMLKAILYTVLDIRPFPKKIKCANCSVATFEFVGGVWCFSGWYDPEIINFKA